MPLMISRGIGTNTNVPLMISRGIGVNTNVHLMVSRGIGTRGQPNPNNSAESKYIRNRIVPFLINRIGNKTIPFGFL